MFSASKLLESRRIRRASSSSQPTEELDEVAPKEPPRTDFADLRERDLGGEAPPPADLTPTTPVGPHDRDETAPASSADATAEEPVRAVYKALIDQSERVFAAAQAGEKLGPGLLDAVKAAYLSCQTGDALLTEVVRQRDLESSLAVRTANTTILTMRLGMEGDYDERRCLAMGMCATMHDVGMLTIPQEVLSAPQLSPQQLAQLRDHPNESKRIVDSFGEDYAWIGKVVVQVHERWNGTGYPQGLAREDIHEFARIIGLADSYEAMAHPRADRAAQVTYKALLSIIENRKRLFDPALVRNLLHIVSMFPLGSLVKLNNGAIGRVIAVNRLHSVSPTVEILLDSRGRPQEPAQEINLEERPLLYIADPMIDASALLPGRTRR